jgi:hypothetical protein
LSHYFTISDIEQANVIPGIGKDYMIIVHANGKSRQWHFADFHREHWPSAFGKVV